MKEENSAAVDKPTKGTTPDNQPANPSVEPEKKPVEPVKDPAPTTPLTVEEQNTTPQDKVESKAAEMDDLIKAAKIDPTALMKGFDADSMTMSVEHKAALIKEHGVAIADLIEARVVGMVADTKTVVQKNNQAVFKQLEDEFQGTTDQTGEETWKELSGWTKQNVSNEMQQELNGMLRAGGLQAALAIQEMVKTFRESSGVTIEADLVEGDNVQAPAASKAYISRKDYNEQLDKLLSSGHNYETSPEVKALNNRRARSLRN